MVRTRTSKRSQEHLSSASTKQKQEEDDILATPPLSKLRHLKKPANESTTTKARNITENARQKYAAAAQLVKEALVADLMSEKNQDVDSVVELANKAFTLLDGLEADYEDLHKAVEDLIELKQRVLLLENEIVEKNQLVAIISQKEERYGSRVENVKKKQECIDVALRDATQKMDPLKRRIWDTRSELEELEKELVTQEIWVKELKQQWTDVDVSRACLTAEKDIIAQEAEAAARVLEEAYHRRNEALARVEMPAAGLCNFLV